MLNLLIASLYKFTGTYFTVVLSHVRTHSVQKKTKQKTAAVIGKAISRINKELVLSHL